MTTTKTIATNDKNCAVTTPKITKKAPIRRSYHFVNDINSEREKKSKECQILLM